MIPAVVPITPSAVIHTRLSHEMSLTRSIRAPRSSAASAGLALATLVLYQ
jgi:hypothetical protein